MGPHGLTVAARVAPPLEMRGPFGGVEGAPPRYFVRNVTAGVFGGDCYDVRLRAGAGVRVRVEPTAATRTYESRGETARSATYVEACSGSELTYCAGTTILQQGSSLEQSVELVAHHDARLRYAEVLVLGRLASGERLRFRRFASSLRVSDGAGGELFSESFRLEPDGGAEGLEGALGGAGVIGTLVLLGGARAVETELLAGDGVFAGASALPRGEGVIVRALGGRVEAVADVLERVLESHEGA